MQVVHWPAAEGAPAIRRSVVTLGVFDGVHRGHVAVIDRIVSLARERSATAVVVTFDRHPSRVLTGRGVPAITSLAHRISLFRSLGVDVCVVVAFSTEVAGMRAEEFARTVFRDLLHAEILVLGFNCRFGRGGEGDAELCRRLGPELGCKIETIPPVEVNGRPVSSTAIREAILTGDISHAEELLGRRFSLYGTVVPGDGRGRELGFPTANLDLHNEAMPPDGVYACWALTDGHRMPAVVSIGRRETFHHEEHAERVVEVHLIGWNEDLYGRDVEVQFVQWLRGQQVFGDAADLRVQIERDVRDALAATRDEG